MLIDLSRVQAVAVANILAKYLQQPDHLKEYVEEVSQARTTPEELFQLFAALSVERCQWPDEHDRQLLLLALAICALDAPGFDEALRRIAAQLRGGPGEQDGVPSYEVFKRFNRDRWRAAPPRAE